MILLTNYHLNKPHQKKKKTKHTLISSSWLCKTTSTQKTTPSITDLYSEKKPTPNIEDFYRELKEAAAMCHFTDKNGEIKSQLITGCLSENVCQKGLMNPNMLRGDLVNYAKTTETISKHLEQMHLEDANSTTKQSCQNSTCWTPSQCWLWTPPKRKVPPCCHRQIPTLCCCRHPGLHLNISHTPPWQDIRRIWCASLPQNGQWPTIQQLRIQNLCLHHRIQTQENNTPMAPGQCGNKTLYAHCKKVY